MLSSLDSQPFSSAEATPVALLTFFIKSVLLYKHHVKGELYDLIKFDSVDSVQTDCKLLSWDTMSFTITGADHQTDCSTLGLSAMIARPSANRRLLILLSELFLNLLYPPTS